MNQAEVTLHCGRKCLTISGVILAVEGDICRDPDIDGRIWTGDGLEKAARLINSAMLESAKA